MTMPSTIRAAAVQFHVGGDIAANLATCLRMLDSAAEVKPDLVVLPEFCNHLSWYNDNDHCFDVSLALDSDFLQAIAAKAREINAHVVIGVTLRRAGDEVTGSNLLYSPAGELLGISDKQVLIGHENDYLTRATEPGAIVDTPLGRLGLYMCMDGVINETPRCLALRGAQVLCNSLNSFAPDEGSLHVPVRAAENKAFVVAANKVGPLVPEAMMADISAATNIPQRFLNGAGESQIVAPDGSVLAIAGDAEEVVYADIEVSDADDKRRPDGSDIFAMRRPELYTELGRDPEQQALPTFSGADSLRSALIQMRGRGETALAEALGLVSVAASDGASLIALPGLFCIDQPDSDAAVAVSARAIERLAEICGEAHVVTSLVLERDGRRQHCAVVIGRDGLVFAQPQVHRSQRFAFSKPADGFAVVELPFGRLGVITSDDSILPESFRLLAMQGAEVVAVPLMPQEAWEIRTGLIERAAENRVNLLVAAQPSELGNSFAAALQADFTIFGEWKSREFDGILTYPITTRAGSHPGITYAELYPRCAENKVVSHRTHLLDGRPWHLLQPITDAA